jgi:uncharacterized RDD family membrane protein YckC
MSEVRAKQPSVIMRYYANVIDFLILGVPRLISLLLFAVFAESSRKVAMSDLELRFGSLDNFDFGDKEALNMLFYSKYIRMMMASVSVCVAIGFVYYLLMTYSSWGCTVGQRVAKFRVVKKDGRRPQFWDVLMRIILSYVVWIFPLLVAINWSSNRVLAVVFILVISMWGDLSFILKRRESVPDVVSGTIFVVGRSEGGLSLR